MISWRAGGHKARRGAQRAPRRTGMRLFAALILAAGLLSAQADRI
jgi:hypothetical protein